MTEKLSQFTPATPALTDYVAGASSGSPNKRFLVSDIASAIGAFQFIVGAGNTLNFYVETTGSNSNGGTNAVTDAWATFQHALDYIAINVNFSGGNVVINLGVGTFAFGFVTGTYFGGGILQIYGSGSASTTITGPNNGLGCFDILTANTTRFAINGVTFQPGNLDCCVSTDASSFVQMTDELNPLGSTDLVLDLSVGTTPIGVRAGIPGTYIEFDGGGNAIINFGGNAITAVLISNEGGTIVTNGAWVVTGGGSLTFAFALCSTTGLIYDSGGGYTQTGGSVTGLRFTAEFGGVIAPALGDSLLGATYYPGNTDGTCDNASTYDGFGGVAFVSGVPTAADLDVGTSGFFKDTSGGGVYAVYNDAGTIKKVTLT